MIQVCWAVMLSHSEVLKELVLSSSRVEGSPPLHFWCDALLHTVTTFNQLCTSYSVE